MQVAVSKISAASMPGGEMIAFIGGNIRMPFAAVIGFTPAIPVPIKYQ